VAGCRLDHLLQLQPQAQQGAGIVRGCVSFVLDDRLSAQHKPYGLLPSAHGGGFLFYSRIKEPWGT
jgi:hypothetical protein